MKYHVQKLILLLKRFSILFLLYQVMRLIFFIYNRHHFQEVNFSSYLQMMKGGLRFDLTAVLYLNILYILLYLLPLPLIRYQWYRKLLLYLFIGTNAVGFAFNLIDIFYFNYILKRSTVEIFMFTGESNIGKLFLQFFRDFWWGFLLFFLLIWLLYKWYLHFKEPEWTEKFCFKNLLAGLFILLVALYFSVVGIRGGFTRTTRPISINNAAAYTRQPLEMAIVLNTPFTLIRTIDKKAFKPVHYFDNDELEKIYSPVKHYKADTTMQKKNVMIIIVESLAREYTGFLNRDIPGYKGYTPFLDSLMQRSHTMSNAYANGRKSIDAMPSVLTSIPSLVQPYVLSPYAGNKINGIADLLQKKGYTTAFFHGAPNGSMGFDAFANLAGFRYYYGAKQYGNRADFDGFWGIPDDLFLQYSIQQLDTFRKPFMVSLFTLSSHHPFKLPKGYEGKFKGGPLPIHKVIEYTDYSLKHFFEVASRKKWFKNTLFIITADHCNQSILPEYNSSVGSHAIPIIYYEPGNPKSVQVDSTLTQQVDIMPYLLRNLNYSGDFVSFGNDPESDHNPFVINYSGHTWEYMQGDYLLRFRDNQSTGLYNYKTDRLLRHNLINRPPVNSKAMEKRLKAFIQQYVNRLIENRLSTE